MKKTIIKLTKDDAAIVFSKDHTKIYVPSMKFDDTISDHVVQCYLSGFLMTSENPKVLALKDQLIELVLEEGLKEKMRNVTFREKNLQGENHEYTNKNN
jgi:hypothetical protein